MFSRWNSCGHRKEWGRRPGQERWPWPGFSRVCISTVARSAIQRVASIRRPKHAPSGQGRCVLQTLERASCQSHSPGRHCQVMTGLHWIGKYSRSSHRRPKRALFMSWVFYSGSPRAVRVPWSRHSHLGRQDTPPHPAPLILPCPKKAWDTSCRGSAHGQDTQTILIGRSIARVSPRCGLLLNRDLSAAVRLEPSSEAPVHVGQSSVQRDT